MLFSWRPKLPKLNKEELWESFKDYLAAFIGYGIGVLAWLGFYFLLRAVFA